MEVLKTLIELDKNAKQAIYLQIAEGVAGGIASGLLRPGARLPGSRRLATWLGVHRNTVVAAFDELEAQGWVKILPDRGAFVEEELPLARPDGPGHGSETGTKSSRDRPRFRS